MVWHVAQQCHAVVQLIFLAHVFQIHALVAITACKHVNNTRRDWLVLSARTDQKVDVRIELADLRDDFDQQIHAFAVDQSTHDHNGD